jgi:hypothetical protein
MARSAVRAAKHRHDEALSEYAVAIAKYHALVEAKMAEQYPSQNTITDIRLPKGQVQELVRLAFTSGGLGGSRFQQVLAGVESLAGRKISAATVRQTLYRMESEEELERYASRWSKGRRFAGPP